MTSRSRREALIDKMKLKEIENEEEKEREKYMERERVLCPSQYFI